MTVSTDPLVGRVLDGRYEITSRIARGGMATVYRAQDRHLMRVVAVKVLHDELAEDQDFARRFDQEAKAAARLVNPHIVSVFDQGIDDARPYIVLEYVPGCTLRHVIAQEAPLSPLRAIDMLEPVVSALASAHENGLVHRDIKPENVLISDRGQIKVADFGLARAITNQSVSATRGVLVGTVSYLPPELVVKDHADERSDVYSTGIVLFEMLTGRKPHTGDNPIQVAWAHVHEDVPAPSQWLTQHAGVKGRQMAGAIPAYLDALVRTCTARDPRERPADGRALLALLRSVRSSLARGRAEDPAITALMHRAGSAQPASPVPAPTRTLPAVRSSATPVSPVDYRPAGPRSSARADFSSRDQSQHTPVRRPQHTATPHTQRTAAARAPHATGHSEHTAVPRTQRTPLRRPQEAPSPRTRPT
ncbi:MAG: protein kinase, partial [Acidipropionibacterium jensenii]